MDKRSVKISIIKFKPLKRLILGLVFLMMICVVNSKGSLATALTKTSQSDWMNGKFEFNEIDAATSAGDIKLQLDLGT